MKKIDIRIERVSPSRAKHLLSFNTGNRQKTPGQIGRFAKMMKNGEWQNNAETIKFTGDSHNPKRCIDGQHRLEAVVLAGVTVEMSLAYNVPEATAATIDAGKGRNNGDHIMFAIDGLKPSQARDYGSAVPRLMIYEMAVPAWASHGHSHIRPEGKDTVAYVRSNEAEMADAWEWVTTHCRRSNKPILPMAELLFIRMITARVSRARSDDFMLKVFAGLTLQPNSIEQNLHEWLLNQMIRGSEKYAKETVRYTIARCFNMAPKKARLTTMNKLIFNREKGHQIERFQ